MRTWVFYGLRASVLSSSHEVFACCCSFISLTSQIKWFYYENRLKFNFILILSIKTTKWYEFIFHYDVALGTNQKLNGATSKSWKGATSSRCKLEKLSSLTNLYLNWNQQSIRFSGEMRSIQFISSLKIFRKILKKLKKKIKIQMISD